MDKKTVDALTLLIIATLAEFRVENMDEWPKDEQIEAHSYLSGLLVALAVCLEPPVEAGVFSPTVARQIGAKYLKTWFAHRYAERDA